MTPSAGSTPAGNRNVEIGVDLGHELRGTAEGMPEVLARVADDPERVCGRVEIDVELFAVELFGERRILDRSRRGGREIDGVDPAGVAEPVQEAVLNSEVDRRRLPCRRDRAR